MKYAILTGTMLLATAQGIACEKESIDTIRSISTPMQMSPNYKQPTLNNGSIIVKLVESCPKEEVASVALNGLRNGISSGFKNPTIPVVHDMVKIVKLVPTGKIKRLAIGIISERCLSGFSEPSASCSQSIGEIAQAKSENRLVADQDLKNMAKLVDKKGPPNSLNPASVSDVSNKKMADPAVSSGDMQSNSVNSGAAR